MSEDRAFPLHYLRCSAEERMKYFKNNVTVAHRALKEALDTVNSFIEEPGGVALVYVVGPTGVGKSTLIRRISRLRLDAATADLAVDKGLIPVTVVEAPAPESGNFNWKDYYVRALMALDEPLIDSKADVDMGSSRTGTGDATRSHPSSVAPELRRALEQTLRCRRVSILFMDEAQHLAKISSGRKLRDQLDCVKGIANATKTLHILVGTYELLPFLELSRQLSRRGRVVELKRYHATDPEDEYEFQTALNTLQRHMPVPEEPNLLRHWEYCYERSIGCIGILKDWLTLALRLALQSGAPTVSLKHLQALALPPSDCRRIAVEAIEGERALQERESKGAELRELLDLPSTRKPAVVQVSDEPATGKHSKQGQRNPGERTPTRDDVGGADRKS